MVFPNPELQWAKVKANQEFFRVCHSSKEGFFLFLIHSFIFFFLYINRELVAMCILLALVIVSPLP